MSSDHTGHKRGIVFITPHQLSTEAKQLIRDGRDNFVKGLPGKGYYDGCKTIDQEVDIELFIHIEIVNGQAYLTVQRGKHRSNNRAEPIDCYTALPFIKRGVILDDVNIQDSSFVMPGGKRTAQTNNSDSVNDETFFDIAA